MVHPAHSGRSVARRLAVGVLLGVLVAGTAGAEAWSLRAASARDSAIGGPHAALADDLSTLFTNPAGFRSAEPELSIAELTVGLAGPIFDLASVFVQAAGGEGIEEIFTSPAVGELLQSLRARFGLVGPIAFGYVGNGLGFGLFNDTDVHFTSSGVVPTLSASVSETCTLAGGYAFRVPFRNQRHALDLGVMLKAFVRGELAMSSDLLGLIGMFESPSIALLLDNPFVLDVGVGVDAGIRYSLDNRFSVGIVVRDAYAPYLSNTYATTQDFLDGVGPATSESMLTPLDLSAGVAFRPALGRLSRVVSDLVLLLDYSDILDFVLQPATARNWVLHIGAGAEIVLLDVLSIRGGFCDGLFAAGLGIDLTFCKLSLSMFGDEASTEPGLAPTYNVVLGLEFRL